MGEQKKITRTEELVATIDYPSNSHKKRKIKVDEVEEKVITQVTQGKVTKQKKSAGKRFFSIFATGEDTETVKSYMIWDVLVPMAKDAVSEMVSGGIEMLLFGTTKASKPRRSTGSVSRGRGINYNRVPAARNLGPYEAPRAEYNRPKANRNFDDIILESRGEAELVINHMFDILEAYEVVSVADLYDLVGITGAYTDHKYGWTNLSRASIRRARGGGYLLDLPRTELID